MSIGAGFSSAEIVELVFAFEALPYGRKQRWLAEQGISRRRLARWRQAVYAGDLDLGLIPREGDPMDVPSGKRRAVSAQRAKEQAEHGAEVARLQARVKELEDVNAALGKAIGLLHQLSEQEPDASPPTTDLPSS